MKAVVISLTFIALASLAQASPYSDFNFDNITYWVGSGSNRAALVIDWYDGKEPQSIAWDIDGMEWLRERT
jgi:hypothetical protein